jgi:hypothetical protein
MEVLIRNAQALFNEYTLPPTPPSAVEETASTRFSYGSLFLSPEFPQYSEVQAMGPVLQPRPLHIHTSTQSTSSVSPPDSTVDVSGPGRLTPILVPLLNPLSGFPHSRSSPDTRVTPTREQVKHNTRSREATSSQDVVPPPPQPTSSQQPSQQRLYALSLSPGARSLLSDITGNPLSSATSL